MGESQQPTDIDIDPDQMAEGWDEGLPIVSVDFIKDYLRFKPAVLEDMKIEVCGDVIEFADVFSWNAFDLCCIRDVPMGISRFDLTRLPPYHTPDHHTNTPGVSVGIMHNVMQPTTGGANQTK